MTPRLLTSPHLTHWVNHWSIIKKREKLCNYVVFCGFGAANFAEPGSISTENVKYHDVDSYQSLLNIMGAI